MERLDVCFTNPRNPFYHEMETHIFILDFEFAHKFIHQIVKILFYPTSKKKFTSHV